jgi:hypothetical protein
LATLEAFPLRRSDFSLLEHDILQVFLGYDPINPHPSILSGQVPLSLLDHGIDGVSVDRDTRFVQLQSDFFAFQVDKAFRHVLTLEDVVGHQAELWYVSG